MVEESSATDKTNDAQKENVAVDQSEFDDQVAGNETSLKGTSDEKKAANAASAEKSTNGDNADTEPKASETSQGATADSQGSDQKEESSPSSALEPASMTLALFIYWIVPMLFIAAFSRIGVDTSIPSIPVQQDQGRTIQIPKHTLVEEPQPSNPLQQQKKRQKETERRRAQQSREQAAPSSSPHPSTSWSPGTARDISSYPTSYQEIVSEISQRRRRWFHPDATMIRTTSTSTSADSSSSSKPTDSSNNKMSRKKESNAPKSPKRVQGARSSSDPRRMELVNQIDRLRAEFEENTSDLFKAIEYADAMRLYDVTYHDGGTYQNLSIEVYTKILVHLRQRRNAMVAAGEPTDRAASGSHDVANEFNVDYAAKSMDGLLCAVYTGLGKVYFMANMFERADQVYTYCLDLEPFYLDALNSRASTRIVLGQYSEAGQDYATVIVKDEYNLLPDALTGASRILETKESAVPGGWEFLVRKCNELIAQYEPAMQSLSAAEGKRMLASALHRYHHVLFVYNDKQAKDYATAWYHLSKAHENKLMTIAPYQTQSEAMKIRQIEQVFREGFWPDGVGSTTRTPIFIIGFPRSGSTLLERVLDAHPLIVGTGENSVFNGRLEDIRDMIVKVSVSGDIKSMPRVTREMADDVVSEMRERWRVLESNMVSSSSSKDVDEEDPLRFVDKMLTNYFNVGFIHMLYPNALILHVIREPMDTLFSAFKHEFPPGRLEYTSDMQALAEFYRTYRETIDHWDKVLPGRVTHVRYEDMVHDMPGMARAIISATGLRWDESVLDFHKKKHYVNTLSTTQVRKEVYKHAIKSWKRYENELQPLMEMVGEYAEYDQITTLRGYKGRRDEL